MPIYEYICKKCGAVSEFLVNVSMEKEEIICRQCKSKELEKKITSSFNVGSTFSSSPSACPTDHCGCTPDTCKLRE